MLTFLPGVYKTGIPRSVAADTLTYRGVEIPKSEVISRLGRFAPLRNKLRSKCAESCEVSAQKSVFPVRKELLLTNNTTIQETNGKNTATPSPLPAGGQAPALLQDREVEQQTKIQQFRSSFGSRRGRQRPEPTAAELEQRRQTQLKALLAGRPQNSKTVEG